MSLSRQSQLDPETEKRYLQEVGSFIMHNLGLIEIREYCQKFIQMYMTHLAQPLR